MHAASTYQFEPSASTSFRFDCLPKGLTEAIKCKCFAAASQVVMLFNNGCSALHFPPLESVQIEKGPCQNLLRGSEEKYSQSLAHKGDMKKEKRGRESQKSGVNRHKSACGGISKRGVCVRALLRELIAMGILNLLWVKSPKSRARIFFLCIFFIHFLT